MVHLELIIIVISVAGVQPTFPPCVYLVILALFIENSIRGQLEWHSGLALPSAQGLILETWDRVPRRTPCMEPASPSAWVSASLSVSHE